MALITRSPDLSLEQIEPVLNAFEIHKLADGSGMLVGFVDASLNPLLAANEWAGNAPQAPFQSLGQGSAHRCGALGQTGCRSHADPTQP